MRVDQEGCLLALLKKRLTGVRQSFLQISLVANKLAEQALAQPGYGLAVVDIARGEADCQDFASMINDDMQLVG
jgi:hypothetical protein